jgi:hypothetical protein
MAHRVVAAHSTMRGLIGGARAATHRPTRMVGGDAGRLASELSTLTKGRRYDEAIDLAQRSLRQYPDSVVLLREARIAFTKAGALTLHLEPTRAQRRIADITKTKKEWAGVPCHRYSRLDRFSGERRAGAAYSAAGVAASGCWPRYGDSAGVADPRPNSWATR